MIAALASSCFAPGALAQPPVAELTVVAYGAQRVDLASGRTILEDGGELVDRGSGVRLTAAWIDYLEGVEVVAREVRFEGGFGRVEAGELVIDLANARLWADGGVVMRHGALALAAASLWFAVESGVVGLVGEVEASAREAGASDAPEAGASDRPDAGASGGPDAGVSRGPDAGVSRGPEASASEAWIELATGRVLLLGPYRFADGPLVLTGDGEAALQLDAVELADGVVYDARSAVDDALAEVVARVRDLLRPGPGG